MQNAKDSFYEVLRDRLATVNPERTVVVRGLSRPGLVVDENEALSTAALPDCFHLRWTDALLLEQGAMPLVAQTCEISYATAGASWNGGLDRGRSLAAMDGELLTALQLRPRNGPKSNYSGLATGGGATPMNTRIWWGDVSFTPSKVVSDRLIRTATVQLMSYQEAGEQ